MKKVIALILALTMTLVAVGAMADTLTMATNASFPPYEYVDDAENAPVVVDGVGYYGIDVEIAAAIAEKLGYDFSIADIAFGAIISGVQTGKYSFGMAGMTVTEERMESVNFSTSYATATQVIIVKEGSPITSIDDVLSGNYVVGVQQDTTGSIYMKDDIGEDKVVEYPTGNDATMALVTGKVDCVCIDNQPAQNYVAANEGLQILPTEYVTENYAACFAKENTELLDAFNAALAELTADGTIDAIVAKYIHD